MKLQPIIEQLSNSKEYKEFMQKYKDAFISAGVFIIDMETGANVSQIDCYVPSQGKFAAFTLGDKVTMQMLDRMNEKVPERLSSQSEIDLDAIKGIIEDEMKNRGMTEDIRKIIAILQNQNGRKIWSLSCMLTGMGLLQAHVEDASQTVLKMEKLSVMDLVKKFPSYDMKMNPNEEGEGEAGEGAVAKTENDAKEKIKKLAMLQKALEKEKQKYEKETKGKK